MSSASGPSFLRRWFPGRQRPDANGLSRDDLLRLAAESYTLAKLQSDACRLYESLGEHRLSAQLYEQMERWSEAAEAYRLVPDWHRAADCFLKCKRYEDAVDALVKQGDAIHAAWICAHHLQRFASAAQLLQDASQSVYYEFEAEAVQARCEVSRNRGAAARRLLGIVQWLAKSDEQNPRPAVYSAERAIEWSVLVARALERPDLVLGIYAAAANAGSPTAADKCEVWAKDALNVSVNLQRNLKGGHG
jgi:hypothetical protein